jgi:hypothetical protein
MMKLSLVPDGPRVRVCATVLGAAFALTACATTSEPQVRTVEVKVPVAVNCTSNIPPPSSYPDTDAALRGAANIGERVKLMLAGKKVRDAEIVELRASVSGCR